MLGMYSKPGKEQDMSAIDARPLLGAVQNDPFPAFSRRRRRGVRVTTAAAMALGLALGGGTIAGAATTSGTAPSPSAPSGSRPSGGSPPAAMGKVTAIGTDSFTLTTRGSATVTVTVSSATTYQDKSASGTLADVKVGDQVAVFGTESSETVAATKVEIGVTMGARPGGKGGGPGGPGTGGSKKKGAPSGSPPSGSGSS
jgi:hypothetical protein